MEFLLIATAHCVALLSPGPDFFLVMQAGLTLPRRYGLAICGGISVANSVYLLLAVLGLEAVRETAWLTTFLRYTGACYLIYLGILLLKTPLQPLDRSRENHLLRRRHCGYQFLIGFLSGILNPKNMIFYLSLFTAMVSPGTSLTTRCLYAFWMTSVVFFWDSFLILVIAKGRLRWFGGNRVYFLEKIAGTMLTFLGTALVFS